MEACALSAKLEPAPTRSIGSRAVLTALLAFLALVVATGRPAAQKASRSLDPEHAYRGMAFLSSAVGREVPVAEIEAFVRECHIDLVVIDFAWITHHWSRTDIQVVESLVRRLRKNGVVVAAMYRPRALHASEARVHFAKKPDGTVPASHLDLCLAWPDSVAWGAAWGEKILEACPSIDRLILYNVRGTCACPRCRGGRAEKHVAAFFTACRKRWARVRPSIRIGHVAPGLTPRLGLDFHAPFLAVNRDAAGDPVPAERLVRDAARLRAGQRPVVSLVKICWASATKNTTQDVVNVIQCAKKARLGFILWYYGWLFHTKQGYDPKRIIEALGGTWNRLKDFYKDAGQGPANPAGKKDAPLQKPGTQNPKRWWIYFPSRESQEGTPPSLVLHTGAGTRTLQAHEDATLIRYLGGRNYGRMLQLAVGVEDQNRALLAFALPRSLRARQVKRAELVLEARPSKMPPRAPVVVAVHRVTAPWSEKIVTWNNQPALAEKPALTLTVPPGVSTVRGDVTALVKAWLTDRKHNHGIALKQSGVASSGDLLARLLRVLPWENDVAEAVKKARASRRLILALVRGAHDPARENIPELLLLATAFVDPTVVSLVRKRFVPLRVAVSPRFFTHGQVPGNADPLTPLGASSEKTKPLALLVARPDGKVVARLESIGTYDAELVDHVLRGALERRGRYSRPVGTTADELLAEGSLEAASRAMDRLAAGPRTYGRCRVAARQGDHALAVRLAHDLARDSMALGADARVAGAVSLMRQGDFTRAARLFAEALSTRPPPGRIAEALYYRGCLAQLAGQPEQARMAFQQLTAAHADTLWALKAEVRTAWPERLIPAENFRSVVSTLGGDRTEQSVPKKKQFQLVQRAIQYLLEQQREDGTWPTEHDANLSAIAALVARALDTWADRLPEPQQKAALAAVARTVAWIQKHLAEQDPKTASSFGAAYMLDFALDHQKRHPQKKANRALVETAMAFLLAGQCPDGAWSYNYRFNETWRGGIGGWPRTTRGRTHSMNTGPALLVLAEAHARGFAVDEKAMARAVGVLKKMRASAGVYTYTYPFPINFQKPDQSIARGPACEHALFKAGAVSRADLHTTLKTFMHYRDALRIPVKLNASWGNPHAFSSYFYFYAYYHAARAMVELGGNAAPAWLEALRQDLLAVPELDATWVDYHLAGKPYGTAMALLVLALAET
jgi:tetratricopeptide (TPR) repeat protein